MDQTYALLLIAALVVVIVAIVIIRARIQGDREEQTPADSPFATSTEGMKICPRCGMGNLWMDRSCVSCGAALTG